jgi:hypothetical protein
MTNETHSGSTPQRFAAVALVWIAAAVPVLAMVPTVATSSAATGIVQVDRPGEQVDVYSMPAGAPVPPPPPVPPHGCDNDNCGDSAGNNNAAGTTMVTGTTTAAATTATAGPVATMALVIAHTPATFESTRSAT